VPPTKAAGARKSTRPRMTKAEQARRDLERRSIKRRLIVAAVLVVGLGAFVVFTRADEDAAVIAELEASGVCHYDTVTDGDPPAGGDVGDVDPAEPGFYEDVDAAPSDVALIKAMRQGFIVLWYPAGTPPDGFHDLSDRFGRDLIVVPRPGQEAAAAVTAWGRRLVCSSVDEAAITRFTEAYRDKGPEKGFL
jgi:hypothetical protein